MVSLVRYVVSHILRRFWNVITLFLSKLVAAMRIAINPRNAFHVTERKLTMNELEERCTNLFERKLL